MENGSNFGPVYAYQTGDNFELIEICLEYANNAPFAKRMLPATEHHDLSRVFQDTANRADLVYPQVVRRINSINHV